MNELRKHDPDELMRLLGALRATHGPGDFRKDDAGKPSLSLLPPRALLAVGRVLTAGAKRYGRDNWRKVAPTERYRYVDAALRHALAYLAGEERDPDSGESHLAHAICSLAFVLELELRDKAAEP